MPPGLYIAGRNFDIETPHGIVNWTENGWDATKDTCIAVPGWSYQCRPDGGPYGPKALHRKLNRCSARPQLRRYGRQFADPDEMKRKMPLEAAQAVIRQFTIHWDGMYDSAGCFHVLQNERGLSCHFLLDNDGVIYQTLDLAMSGFHASEYNHVAIGVEICNRGDAKKWPHYYDKGELGNRSGRYPRTGGPNDDGKHPIRIHGHKVIGWGFTREQHESMTALAKALVKLLPNLPVEYPQTSPGVQSWGLLGLNPQGGERLGAINYSGYLGHYHITTRKWDPGPFDFKAFCEGLRGSRCFPMWTGMIDDSPDAKPEIPEDLTEMEEGIAALYKRNEERAHGGYFPVGPWGDSRLWHGGVHLAGNEREPVYAPFNGRVMAARMGAQTAIGSANFVLVRHDMAVGTQSIRFYALYMHLYDETKEAAPVVPWMTRETWLEKTAGGKHKGEVVLLDEPVKAGEVIGRFGKAGPTVDDEDLMKPQVHFEIFSSAELFADDEEWNSKWILVDGTAGGRFCEVEDLVDKIDLDKDKVMTRRELIDFFEGTAEKDQLRYMIVYSVSEWTDDPPWLEALLAPADFRGKDAEVKAMVEEQITPFLWWDADLAKHARLPYDGVVYHYHPLTFIRWINEKILIAAADPDNAIETVDAKDAEVATDVGLTVDLGDDSHEDDGDMISDRDLSDDDGDSMIELRHLIEGYAGDPEAEL